MKKIVLSAALFGGVLNMMAGGYLTNTNQSVTFLRNPAQDANIALNGVYSNPAGVSFLSEGFHLGVNLQSAYQTRKIQSTFAPFKFGRENAGEVYKTFKANAKAPVIPSLQGAWVNGPLSLQLNLALVGGGGKATYDNGLGSFESKVSLLSAVGKYYPELGFDKYDVDAYMHGRQYFYGLTLGAAYRLGEHFSVYGGVRGILASAHYDGHLRNIRVGVGSDMTNAEAYFGTLSNANKSAALNHATQAQNYARLAREQQEAAQTAAAAAQAAKASGNLAEAQRQQALLSESAHNAKEFAGLAQKSKAKAESSGSLAKASGALAASTGDVNIDVHQHGVGVAPIVGAHFHSRFVDVAAKYEFRTRIAFSNEAKNSDNTKDNAQFAQFADKAEVRSDLPALLTLGLRVRPIERLSVNLGYHHYFDKQAKSGIKGAYKNDLLDHGTQEFLAGVEYDLTRQWQVSAGMQRTLYPNNDAFMNDVSFNVNSVSVGLGFGYRLNEHVKLNAAYFHTFYENYLKSSSDYNGASALAAKLSPYLPANVNGELLQQAKQGAFRGADLFTRSNSVFGVSAEFKF